MKIGPVTAELIHADGQTDRHDEATRNFANAPINEPQIAILSCKEDFYCYGLSFSSITNITSEVHSIFLYFLNFLHTPSFMGRDSSVGIATRYGLESPGIESRWGRDFPHLSRPALGPTQPPVQRVPGLSRG